MNKKLAFLLFAIGIGTSTAQAVDPCAWACLRASQECVNNGGSESDCVMERIDCYARCGI